MILLNNNPVFYQMQGETYSGDNEYIATISNYLTRNPQSASSIQQPKPVVAKRKSL